MSLWIPVTVFLAVMALLFALLPTMSSAQADEVVTEDSTISEIADELGALNDPILIEETETSPEVVEEDTVIVDDEPAETTDNEVVDPDGGNALLDALDGLIGPMQVIPMQATDQDAEGFRPVVVTADGIRLEGGQVGNIYVGDNVEIFGTWDASALSPNLAAGDRFKIDIPDPPLRLVPIPIDQLVDAAGNVWGNCAPNVGASRYECTITNVPIDPISGQPYTGANGEWQGTAIANAVSSQYNILGSDYSLGKSGRLISFGGELVDQPAATVTRWTGVIDGPPNTFITDDIVLVDTFDPKLKVCENDAVTNLIVGRLGEPLTADIDVVGNVMTITIDVPPTGIALGTGSPISIVYSLCTASGGMDPRGTEYQNNLVYGNITADASVTQTMQTSGTAIGVTRGSFSLNKVLDSAPTGFDPAQSPFAVKVEEFAPGEYPGGTAEATYVVQVRAGAAPVTGRNARPAGWTIRLSEVAPPAFPGHDWGTPVFTGAGVTPGSDANGPFAVITTTQAGNVGVSLTNYLFNNVPLIGTTAQVQGVNDNVLPLTGGTVVDTVAYENLKPNTAYTLDGKIVAVAADNTFVDTGITASGSFTTGPAAAGELFVDGTTEVTFTISAADAERLADQKLVVFERLLEPGGATPTVPVAVHEDPTDLQQTFFVDTPNPEIGTSASVDGPNGKLLPLTGGTVVDTVTYKYLEPNTQYRLDGELMHVVGATATATGITSSAVFTTPAAPAGELFVSGTQDVTFTITADQAATYGGQKLVVYEDLINVGTSATVAEHRNPNDQAQTFFVEAPEITIGTSAATNGPNTKLLPLTGGEVVDTVSYTNLKPNTEYRLAGELVHVDGATVLRTGIMGETIFTTGAPDAGENYVDGTALVVFTISAAQAEQYGGQTLVVFEDLFEVGITAAVALHRDPTDIAQTFEVERPEIEIGTKANVTGSPANVLPITGGTVVDTVSYTNLVPNTEYRLEGELMHVDAANNVTATGIIAAAAFTTPAADAGEFFVSGTTNVTFTITAGQAAEYGGQKLVVFEELFLATGVTPIAEHQDPNDEDQTFTVEVPEIEIGTKANVTGSADNILPVTGGEVIDTVSYTNLKPNTEYRLDGELMHVAGATVTPTGIFGSTTFTTDAAPAGEFYVSGTVNVIFTISAADAITYAGEKLVVFEELFEVGITAPVADHKDPNDEDQTFDIEPGGEIIVEKKVTGPKGDDVENDEDAVFQIKTEWIDRQGDVQTRTFNVTPGEPVSLEGLPLNTEITLTEVGANTSVGNVKWGEIIWSGEGVVDEPGASPSGVITITDPDAPIQVGLENKTSSNALIIIPIPLPLVPIGGGSSVPPAPVAPTPTTPAEAAPLAPEVSPKDGIQPPSPKDGIQPQRGAAPMAQQGAAPQTQRTGLASTGADVIWLAGGGIMILLLGTWLVLRGRRNES